MQSSRNQTLSIATSVPLLRRSTNSSISISSKPLITPLFPKPTDTKAPSNIIHSSTPSISKYIFTESPLNPLSQITSPKKLPKKLSNLSQFELNQEIEGLGIPATRKDVTELKAWLNTMLQKAMDATSSPESLYDTANRIYKVCFQEIIRQVKVQCKERGELIKLVWDSYQKLFQQAIWITQTKQDCLEKLQANEKLSIEAKYEGQISELMKVIGELRKVNGQLEKNLKNKEEAYEYKLQRELKMLQVLDLFKQQYAKLKEELLVLREENRVCNIKLENIQNIKIKAENKFKRKSELFIKQAVRSDPLMRYTGAEDESEMIRKLVDHEKEEQDLFSRPDFVEKGSNTNILTFADSSINTNVEDLCGESIGTKTRRRKRSKISDTHHITVTPTQQESLVPINSGLQDTNPYQEAEMKRKHVYIKKMLQNMNQVTVQ